MPREVGWGGGRFVGPGVLSEASEACTLRRSRGDDPLNSYCMETCWPRTMWKGYMESIWGKTANAAWFPKSRMHQIVFFLLSDDRG